MPRAAAVPSNRRKSLADPHLPPTILIGHNQRGENQTRQRAPVCSLVRSLAVAPLQSRSGKYCHKHARLKQGRQVESRFALPKSFLASLGRNRLTRLTMSVNGECSCRANDSLVDAHEAVRWCHQRRLESPRLVPMRNPRIRFEITWTSFL